MLGQWVIHLGTRKFLTKWSPPCNEDLAIREQCDCGSKSWRLHILRVCPPASAGVVYLGAGKGIEYVIKPSGNENLPVRQQDGRVGPMCVSHTASRCPDAGAWIVQLGTGKEIAYVISPSGNEDLAIRKESCCV